MRRKKGEQGRRLADPGQAGRPDLDPGRQHREAHLRRAEGRPCRHARSAGHRHPADRAGRGDQDRALRRWTASKTYRFTLQLRRGAVDRRCRGRGRADHRDQRPTDDAIRAMLPQFTGLITQVPPAFSAIKVEGERAYDLARAGEVVELEPRQVLDPFHPPARRGRTRTKPSFEVLSGKGAYMRALGRDLAVAIRDLRPYPGPAADRGRAVHRGQGDFAGISEGPGA